jgi:hypothetical protein
MRGLDPRIHAGPRLFGGMAARRKRAFSMDCRVKPGNDEQRLARRFSAVMAGLVPAIHVFGSNGP